MTGYLRGDLAELQALIADARREQERDEPRHGAPDGPWWFPTRSDREQMRGEQ